MIRLVVSMAALLAPACGDERRASPSMPSAPGASASAIRFRITGPTSVAPGQSVRYTAIADFNDDTSQDVTLTSQWSPADPNNGFFFPVYFTSPGTARTTERGETTIRARYAGSVAELRVFVLEPGTFNLGGDVFSSGGEPLSNLYGVTVEVLAGTGKGLKAPTNGRGHYALYGVAGPVQLSASAPGFHPQTRDVVVTHIDSAEPFVLTPLRSALDVSGTWTVTVSPSPTCPAGLPHVAQNRSYEVELVQRDTSIRALFSSPTLTGPSPLADLNPGTVVGSQLRLLLIGDTDMGEWASPSLIDELSPTERFGFSGLAEGMATERAIDATLTGDLVYWTTTSRSPVPWYCRARDHVLRFRR